MKVSIIVAMDEKRGIGRGKDLLFRIPEDFKRMRSITIGHSLIMGRKTFESLGRLLPERTHIVVTRDKNNLKYLSYQPHEIVTSVAEGLEKAKRYPGAEEIFIFGGSQIYKEALKKGMVDKIYLTLVKGNYEADTFFPEYSGFKIVNKEQKEAGGYQYTFLTLEK